MSIKIYDQHDAAFKGVSAYVIVDARCTRVASIAFKHPRDGAGRLYCYLHVFGTPMVRGFAAGGGCDKHSAAADNAATHLEISVKHPTSSDTQDLVALFRLALKDGLNSWGRGLQNAGFQVFQAV